MIYDVAAMKHFHYKACSNNDKTYLGSYLHLRHILLLWYVVMVKKKKENITALNLKPIPSCIIKWVC